MIIGTCAASVATTINLTWVPEEIAFVAATAPSSLRVSVLGEGVIMDLDAAGVNALSNIRSVSRVLNAFVLNLADGIIKGKNVEITFVNTVASPVVLYGFGEREGNIYIQKIRQALLANSGATFQKFGVLALPGLGGADTIDIRYHDGLTQRFTREELSFLNMRYQINSSSFIIDNLDGLIDSVSVVPVAAQSAYIMRYSFQNETEISVFEN